MRALAFGGMAFIACFWLHSAAADDQKQPTLVSSQLPFTAPCRASAPLLPPLPPQPTCRSVCWSMCSSSWTMTACSARCSAAEPGVRQVPSPQCGSGSTPGGTDRTLPCRRRRFSSRCSRTARCRSCPNRHRQGPGSATGSATAAAASTASHPLGARRCRQAACVCGCATSAAKRTTARGRTTAWWPPRQPSGSTA